MITYSYNVLIIILLLCTACSTSATLRATPAANQNVIYEKGSEVLLSRNKSIVAVAAVSNIYNNKEMPSFVITYYNGTSSPLNFSTENISAMINGHFVKVLTIEDMASIMEKQRRSEALTAALIGASQMINSASGMQYHSGTFDSNYYGSYGSGYVSGNYSGTTYDPAAAAQAQAIIQSQTNASIESINAAASNRVNEMRGSYLLHQTVMPNEWYGGRITLDRLRLDKENNELIIVINAGNEVHIFQYNQN